MGTFGWILVLAVAFVFVLWLVNQKAVREVFSAGRAQLGKVGRSAGSADPLANFQQQVDDAAESIKRAKEGMTRAVALISSVERQVLSGRQEKARLEKRIENALEQGNEAKAADYAAQLADCETTLKENEDQLQSHKDSYQGFVNEVKRQQQKVTNAQRDAVNLGVRLEMSQANKQFHEFESTFTASNGALQGLDKEKEAVLRQIDENNAYRQVNKDVGGGTTFEQEDEDIDRQIKAQKILKRFKPGSAPVGDEDR